MTVETPRASPVADNSKCCAAPAAAADMSDLDISEWLEVDVACAANEKASLITGTEEYDESVCFASRGSEETDVCTGSLDDAAWSDSK